MKIQDLNLIAFIKGDKENSELNCAMYHDNENLCECKDGDCITENGLYFGTGDEREPQFCPFHYFKDTGYKIEPLEEDKTKTTLTLNRYEDEILKIINGCNDKNGVIQTVSRSDLQGIIGALVKRIYNHNN